MKNKLFNNPFISRDHPSAEGVQRIYKFPNGYGASVVRFKMPSSLSFGLLARTCADNETYGSYTNNENEWELAVIEDIKGEGLGVDYKLTYDTPITDDVIGHLEEDDVEKILLKISQLPTKQ